MEMKQDQPWGDWLMYMDNSYLKAHYNVLLFYMFNFSIIHFFNALGHLKFTFQSNRSLRRIFFFTRCNTIKWSRREEISSDLHNKLFWGRPDTRKSLQSLIASWPTGVSLIRVWVVPSINGNEKKQVESFRTVKV